MFFKNCPKYWFIHYYYLLFLLYNINQYALLKYNLFNNKCTRRVQYLQNLQIVFFMYKTEKNKKLHFATTCYIKSHTTTNSKIKVICNKNHL